MTRVLVLSLSALLAGSAAADDIYLDPGKFDTKQRELLKSTAAAESGPLSKEQTDVARACARYFIYRITEKGAQTRLGGMKSVVTDCEYWFRTVFTDSEAKNATLKEEFGKMARAELKVVLSNPQQPAIVKVNATRLVALLADLSKQEDTADVLLAVLEAPSPDQNDGARYYALRGLGTLLALGNQTPPVPFKNAQRKEKVVEALVSFVERKPPFSADPSHEEKEGLKVVRREALRALGEVRDPVAGNNSKTRTALPLARVLRRDKSLAALEPRLDEQVEAAVGLARLRADAGGDYQAGVAAYHIGAFLLDFAREYQERKDNRHPWKVYAARMNEALGAMAAAFPADPAVKAVTQAGREMLARVENGQAPNQGNLDNWVKGTPPAAPALYKSDPKSVVEPGGEAVLKSM